MNENGKTISDADRAIIRQITGSTEKAISDADRDIIGKIIDSLTKKKMPSPIPMPAKIKQMRADKARRDSKGGDYSENPVMQTLRNNKGMKEGGKVNGYKNGGCVMAGRGGKFKGIS